MLRRSALGRHFPGSSGGAADGAATHAGDAEDGPSQEELAEEGRRLCRAYISHRLQRSGLLTQKLADSLLSAAAVTDGGPASQELRLVGEQLEAMYPDLYKNVHKQLNITMHSEDVVRRTFAMFAEQLCSGGVHWGKIVALFAMAGAFAVDCVQQGRQEFVSRIVDCFGAFVAARLTDWLRKQGGWVIPEVTRDAKRESDRTWFWLMLSVGALVLFVSTLLISASL
uniref:BCL domain-containing protein n=1 Tax=Macrostomum lignano TaxID=282301 RepID=A0A1I8J681_9PLAT